MACAAWALYDIASNPEVQSKLKAELEAAGLIHSGSKGPGRAVAWDDLSLPYFSAILKESMRLHPVAGVFRCGESTYLSGDGIYIMQTVRGPLPQDNIVAHSSKATLICLVV